MVLGVSISRKAQERKFREMGKSPFFTILTASFSRGSTIKHTLQSVRDQTFHDLEHIVIDGGSKDQTLQILKEFENTYNLTWISEPDRGISDALNKGLNMAHGRYILVIQADDRLAGSKVLEQIYPIVKSEEFDICSFPVIVDSQEHGVFLRRPIRVLWWNRFKTIFPHQGSFVHRRVFSSVGTFRDEFSIALDYDFFYRALVAGCSVKFEAKPAVAIMGGEGVGSRNDFLLARIREEAKVQRANEKRVLWRFLQRIFHSVYVPYKSHVHRKSGSVLSRVPGFGGKVPKL